MHEYVGFFNSSLKDLLVKFNECGDTFLERLRPHADGKTEVSMKEAFHEATLDAISKVCNCIDQQLNLKLQFCLECSAPLAISFTMHFSPPLHLLAILPYVLADPFKNDQPIMDGLSILLTLWRQLVWGLKGFHPVTQLELEQ